MTAAAALIMTTAAKIDGPDHTAAPEIDDFSQLKRRLDLEKTKRAALIAPPNLTHIK